MDEMSDDTILICATNLFKDIDMAFIRRFDMTFNFDCYTLIEKRKILEKYIDDFSIKWDPTFKLRFYDLFNKTYDLWTPSYIQRLARITAIWQHHEIIPFFDLKEIFDQLNINKIVAEQRKVNKITIKYFFMKGDN